MVPVFDIEPNQNPQAFGTMTFQKEGDSTPAWSVDTDGRMVINGVTFGPGAAGPFGEVVTGGELVASRRSISQTTNPLATGTLSMSFFTAQVSETITNVTITTAGTAAAGITLARIGVYVADSAGNLTLVGATASDTTLANATFSRFNRNFATPWSKIAGQTYAAGLLFVGTTMPTIESWATQTAGTADTIFGISPRMTGNIGGQADLPASIPVGSIVNERRAPFVELYR